MYGEQKQKMMNSILVIPIFAQCNSCLHSNPGITKSLPSRIMLVTMRWQTQEVDRSSTLVSSNSMMWACATPAVVVITRWWQCQPLGQRAAALAMWISQIKAGSNLLWSVRGNRWWWRDKQLESEIAQLIQTAIRSRTRSHHRKLLQMLQMPLMRRQSNEQCVLGSFHTSLRVIWGIDSNHYTCCQRGNGEGIHLSSRNHFHYLS